MSGVRESKVAPLVKAGDFLEVPNPAVVTLPNGDVVRVTGGVYIAEQDGPHRVKKG